ncbi:MAG: hypothetical protein KDN05_23790 [Verrucomicrobiae bacterium]|nr:hypothetical protein [Verrucomicrobiae bacterium]
MKTVIYIALLFLVAIVGQKIVERIQDRRRGDPPPTRLEIANDIVRYSAEVQFRRLLLHPIGADTNPELLQKYQDSDYFLRFSVQTAVKMGFSEQEIRDLNFRGTQKGGEMWRATNRAINHGR